MVNLKNLVRASLMATVAAGAFGGAAVAQLNQTLEVARGDTANGAQTQSRIEQLGDQRTDIATSTCLSALKAKPVARPASNAFTS